MITKAEMAECLGILGVCYQGFEVNEARVEAWHMLCHHHEQEVFFAALKGYAGSRTEFPTPAAINKFIQELQASQDNTWGEAFEVLHRALQVPHCTAQAAYDSLPRRIQQAVGGYSGFRESLMWETRDMPTHRAQFRDRYSALTARDKNLALLPGSIQKDLLTTKEQSGKNNVFLETRKAETHSSEKTREIIELSNNVSKRIGNDKRTRL